MRSMRSLNLRTKKSGPALGLYSMVPATSKPHPDARLHFTSVSARLRHDDTGNQLCTSPVAVPDPVVGHVAILNVSVYPVTGEVVAS